MIYFILTYAAFTVLLCAIEKWRIDAKKGEVLNIKHSWSGAGAILAFIATVAIFNQWNLYVLCLGVSCWGIRGAIYDPVLNIFRGEYIDYESPTTDSKSDKAEKKRKISFWMQRLLYLILAAAGYGLYLVSILIFK